MEISLKTLLKGKATIIKNKKFFKTEHYVELFLDYFKQYEHTVFVKTSTQSTLNKTNNDLIFNQVWIQCKTDQQIYNHTLTYNLVYALDIKKPVLKFYRSWTNNINGNHLILKDIVYIKDLQEEDSYSSSILDELITHNDSTNLIIEYQNLNIDDPHHFLGYLIDQSLHTEISNWYGVAKISPNDIINAYNNVYNNTLSDYYSENKSSCYNMIQAILAEITKDDKDILNKFEKNLIVIKLIDKYVQYYSRRMAKS